MLIYIIYFIICSVLIALLLIFPGVAHIGTDLGVKLFMEALFPYLLPYLILTQWFIRLTESKERASSKLQLYLKVYGISALGGFPTGAATIAFLKKSKQISSKEAIRLISICHSPSPLFVIGFVGQDLLKNTMFSWKFLILYHVISFSLLMAFYLLGQNHHLRHNKHHTVESAVKQVNPFASSIKDSIPTVLIVGATIIFFTTIYTVVMHSIATFFPTMNKNFALLIAASLEMTNGLQIAQQLFSNNMPLLFILCTFFLTTQSLSIHMQVAVIAKTEKISLKLYFLLRVILAIIMPIFYYLLFL